MLECGVDHKTRLISFLFFNFFFETKFKSDYLCSSRLNKNVMILPEAFESEHKRKINNNYIDLNDVCEWLKKKENLRLKRETISK